MIVNKLQRIKTPNKHHARSFLIFTFNPVPTAILIGAPTVIVPKMPRPAIPYLFHSLVITGCFSSIRHCSVVSFAKPIVIGNL